MEKRGSGSLKVLFSISRGFFWIFWIFFFLFKIAVVSRKKPKTYTFLLVLSQTCVITADWGDENERRKKKRVRLRFRKKNKGDFNSCLPPRFCPPNPTCLSFFFFLCPTLFIDDNQVEKERYFFNRKTIMKWKKGGRLGFCLQKNKSRKLWKKERREDSFSFATIKNAIERPRHQGRPRRCAALAQKKVAMTTTLHTVISHHDVSLSSFMLPRAATIFLLVVFSRAL